MVSLWMWIVFAVIVIASLAIDLVSHRDGRSSSRRAAMVWTAVWIGIAIAFAIGIGVVLGSDRAEDFLTAYVMEKSLSIDNLFVFLLVFGRLRVSAAQQHRVLYWGILGALVFRGGFVVLGSAVIAHWHQVLYLLGVALIVAGWRAARSHGAQTDSGIMRVLRDRFHVRSTFPLALMTIELTDVMFAVDSVPAVFAITDDPFIVYTSNVFAILGLRSLYLVLAELLASLRYLHWGLALVLVLAGLKMLTHDVVAIPHLVSLAVTVGVVAITVVMSLIDRRERSRVGSWP